MKLKNTLAVTPAAVTLEILCVGPRCTNRNTSTPMRGRHHIYVAQR
jgi:hypothetical protein